MRLLVALVLVLLLTGCMSPQEQMSKTLVPVLEQLPEIVRVVQEAQGDEADGCGGRNVVIIYINVPISPWRMPLSVNIGQ